MLDVVRMRGVVGSTLRCSRALDATVCNDDGDDFTTPHIFVIRNIVTLHMNKHHTRGPSTQRIRRPARSAEDRNEGCGDRVYVDATLESCKSFLRFAVVAAREAPPAVFVLGKFNSHCLHVLYCF